MFRVTDDGRAVIDIVTKPTAERLQGRLRRSGLRYVPYLEARRQAQEERAQNPNRSEAAGK